MKNIDRELAALYYDRLAEILSNEKLTPSERIPKYRTVLDDLFKVLTGDSNRLMTNLFARVTFVFTEHTVPKLIMDATHSLRTYGNRIVYESAAAPGAADDARCVYEATQVIQYFSQEHPPDILVRFYTPHLGAFKMANAAVRSKPALKDIFAVVTDVFLPRDEGAGTFCVLTCDTDTHGSIKVTIRNNRNEKGFGGNPAAIGGIIEPFQNVYFSEITAARGKEDDFSTLPGSLVVLEPDYLIDAKELAECRQFSSRSPMRYEDNPLLYILNRFTKGEITDKMMVGNIVGTMLDDIVADKKYSYATTFAAVMRLNSFGMLCIAHNDGAYDRSRIGRVYEEAKLHEQTLRETIAQLKGKQLILEPTFISNKYGLQGRLDLLVDHGDGSSRKDIIELKSSANYPGANTGLFSNHEAQTMCYDLLVSSTYPGRTGISSILYSRAPLREKPVRSVDGDKIYSKQDLLMLRNTIVASEIKMANGNFDAFNAILTDAFGAYPKYLDGQVREFRNAILQLTPLLHQYFFGYLKFIYKELQIAKIGGSSEAYNKSNGYADLWKASIEEKKENYDVLVYLKVKSVLEDYQLVLEASHDLFSGHVSVSSFRVGDTAILYPTPDPDTLHPLNSQILKCRVISVDANEITVSLVNRQLDMAYFASSLYWALDRDFRETGYRQLFQQLYEFVKADARVVSLVLGTKRPEFGSGVDIEPNGLDPVQLENVKRALAAKDYYLIQGPPGTGKTSKVLVEIVRNLALSDNAVMVVAYTNRAVDEICEKLLSLNIDCIRLGKGEKPYNLSAIANRCKLDELHGIVQKNKVFVSTISTFTISLDILKLRKFASIIIDEASQVLEPQIVGILKYFRTWIFIGDENQLPAVVSQSESDSVCGSEDLKALSLSNFRESLFYRLKKNAVKNGWNDCHGVLKFQYRMHRDIAEFSREHFYNGELEEANETLRDPLPSFSGDRTNTYTGFASRSRIIFVPTAIDAHSKINEHEARLAATLLNDIADVYKDAFDPLRTVGIITPFRAQIANIRKGLSERFRQVTIDTVERFQGSERDIIIFSFAIKNIAQFNAIQSMNEEGVDRKLNVALTRAKSQLIILGNDEIFTKNPVYRKLSDFIKAKGGFIAHEVPGAGLGKEPF